MNKRQRRELARAAVAIRHNLTKNRPHERLDQLPAADAFVGAQRRLERVRLAASRGWRAAALIGEDRLHSALEELKRQVDAWLLARRSTAEQPLFSTPGEIYGDLAALHEEFAEVRVHLKERQLAVVTEPVQLDGVHLGRFQIVLDYDRLDEGSACYEIMALDPQAAAADESVVHPHVRDGTLCEGEAYGPIRAALSAGRIWDFFVVVARTLASYNAESAFVSLDRWHGRTCADCGYTAASDDDGSSCQACQCDLCSECGSSCASCGRTSCSQCSWICQGCRESSCEGCLLSCQACDEDFCERCLSDGQCAKCRESAAQEEAHGEAETRSPTAASAEPALHALCDGEARAPA
jgi:hypothetical protein